MSVGSRTAIPRRASLAGSLAGVLALGAVVVADTTAAYATETLALKTVVSMPAGAKITSFDISFVDPLVGYYILGDRTNKGIDVISTATNTLQFTAGAGLFKGVAHNPDGSANNNLSGPDGAMIVRSREIWAGDGDSTLKILSLANGALLATISTGGQFRVDEMCFDPVHNIGFVANNADNPPFITAVSGRTHSVIGKIVFDGTNNTPLASDGIEQCQFNPRDNMIYVAVPEINGPGDNSVAGGVSRIDPVANHVVTTAVIPITSCNGPQGLTIGPVVAGHGTMLTGCNGANANAAPNRPTAVIADGAFDVFGSGGNGSAAIVVFTLPFEAGNDMVWYNSGDNHYYLARSGNNAFNNPAGNPTPLGCPNVPLAANYGANIYVSQNTLGASYPIAGANSPAMTGPQALGMVNASTGIPNADTITGLFNCAASNPGPGRVGTAGVANAHGTNHSVAADSAHNYIYVPIASTAFQTGTTGPCTTGGGLDANGCIAVYNTVGAD
jgi:hypothetical protein